MQAQDIMTTNVITVYPDASIQYIAKRLIENRISAIPVVEMDGRIAGIVSEGDLMRRSNPAPSAIRHGGFFFWRAPKKRRGTTSRRTATMRENVMTRRVITVNENTSIQEVAETLEKHRIKRVPVMRGDKSNT